LPSFFDIFELVCVGNERIEFINSRISLTRELRAQITILNTPMFDAAPGYGAGLIPDTTAAPRTIAVYSHRAESTVQTTK